MPIAAHSNRPRRLALAIARATALATAMTLAGGCSGDDGDDGAALVIDNATSSLQSILLLAQLAEVAFEVDRTLSDRTVAEAAPIATADLVANIDELVLLLGCDASAETSTDNATFVEVAVDCESQLFGVGLTGRLRAALAFETTACPAGECPAVLVWTLSSPEAPPFSYTAAAIRLEITEPALLRFPVDPAGTRTLTADRVDVSNNGTFAAEVNASWIDDGCITMTLDSVLTEIPGSEDPDLAQVFPIVFSGQDVRVCFGRCPSEGRVFLSYAFGTILEWMYTASNVVDVIGPRAEAIRATLACAP